MSNQRFASVWDAIGDTPSEAESLKLRSRIMFSLKQHILRTQMGQAEAGKILGVEQARVADLMGGKIDAFAVVELLRMAEAAGLQIEPPLAGPF